MTGDPAPGKSRHRLTWSFLIVAVIFVLSAIVGVGRNAYGQNIAGTVHCANAPIAGVYIEADRLPRVGADEVQSGFSYWYLPSIDLRMAKFRYWLPYGGKYSVHVGCGGLKDGALGAWSTDNRAPFVQGSGYHWWCDDPPNIMTVTVITLNCRFM
jgi:hypothetical protein